jgi:FMN phosphatase YigB (HAD superfamily)
MDEASQRMLIVFDFDQTLTEIDSDQWVLENISPPHQEKVRLNEEETEREGYHRD